MIKFALSDTSSSHFHPFMQVALRFSSLAYSPSGALLVGGSEYGALYIWDAFSGEVLFGPLPSHTCDMGDLVTHLCFVTDDIVLSSCFDGSIHQWNIRAGEPIGEAFTAHSRSVLKVASLPDKKMAASITVNGELILWRLDTLEVVRQSRVMVDVAVFAFSSDGTKMATLYHHMLHTYDVENCRLISEVDLKPYIPPMSLVLAFSLNASKVFFGSGSDSLAVWDVDKEEIKEEILILDYRNPVEIICSPDGALVASLSNGRQNKIHIWSTATRELVDVLDDGGPFPAFAFTPDSKNLTYVLRDTELSVNPLKNIKKVCFLVASICH